MSTLRPLALLAAALLVLVGFSTAVTASPPQRDSTAVAWEANLAASLALGGSPIAAADLGGGLAPAWTPHLALEVTTTADSVTLTAVAGYDAHDGLGRRVKVSRRWE